MAVRVQQGGGMGMKISIHSSSRETEIKAFMKFTEIIL